MAHEKINVVLLGKPNTGVDNEHVISLIAAVSPSSIPIEFVHEIGVITKNNKRYNIHKPNDPRSPKEISYKKIDEYVKSLPTESEVVTMEIILDLAKVSSWLNAQTSELLNKVFDQDQ